MLDKRHEMYTLTRKDLGLDSPRSSGTVELKDGTNKTLWGYVGTARFQVVHDKQDMQIVCYDGPDVDEALRIFNELR